MARKIFESHVWNGQHRFYWDLISLLDQARRFSFVDLSVPRLRPFDGDYTAVRNEILGVLRQADVVLVINMPIITNSEPVKDELREAEEHGIPIIAIKPAARHGITKASRLDVIKRADKANWTANSIVSAIRKATKKRRTALKTALEPFADAAYEPISDAATEAPRSHDKIVLLRRDEQLIAHPITTAQDFMDASHATPTAAGESVRIQGDANSSPKLPWFRRFWRWWAGAKEAH
jgi:hypothetical protein